MSKLDETIIFKQNSVMLIMKPKWLLSELPQEIRKLKVHAKECHHVR